MTKPTDEKKKRLSRRSFIKTTAAGTGAAAAAGTGFLSVPKLGAQTPAGLRRYSFETPPPPIPEATIKETLTADVVVVGAGTAGLSAALAASTAGAKVILIEKMGELQGRGGDNTALNSKIHKKLGITLDKNPIIDALMKRGEGRLDQNLLNLWADHSGRVMDIIIDLLEKEGLPTYLVIPDRGDEDCAIIDRWPNPTGFPANWDYRSERNIEYPTCHRPGGKGENQKRWLRVVENQAMKQGADIQYNTKATQLVRDGEQGRVTAVVAQKKDGSYLRYVAKRAIVLCTGDYGFNREMVEKYCPQMQLPCMVRTSTGEGHQMAMWIGAVMENPPHAPMSHMFHVMGTDAFLQVNRFGKRFYNEDADTESMANQAYEQGGVWVVFDGSWDEDVTRMGPGFKRVFRVDDKVRKEFADVAAGKGGGPWGRQILQADTIEALAEKMKVPVATFKATVARYNQLVKMGKDLDYGKRPDRLTAIDKPPYYAEWTDKPSMSLVVLGGLIVNERLQPVDKDGQPIAGLYLGGNTIGRRFKSGYPLILPGISHSMAFTFGYLAGEYASGANGSPGGADPTKRTHS